jgi:hypothetical protein
MTTNPQRRLFRNTRVLFVIDRCPYCAIWKEFIDRLNVNLPIQKRIKVIDCTFQNQFGMIEHPLIKVFDKYLDSYPVLFFEGQKITETNSRVEIEAWLKTRMRDEFMNPVNIPYLFTKECSYQKRPLLGRTIVCQD